MKLPSKKRVFISYQRQQEATIRALAEALDADQQYDVWYDQKMHTGNWWDQIIKHMKDSDIVILALSESYLKSEACKREVKWAKQTNRALLPIIVDPNLPYEAVPEDIRALQIDKYFGQVEQYFKLRANLDQITPNPLPTNLGNPPDAPMDVPTKATPKPQTPPLLRFDVWGVIALVIAAVVIVFALILTNNGGDTDNTVDAQSTVATEAETPATISNLGAASAVTDSPDDLIPSEEPADAGATTQAVTSAVPGNFDITLVYGGQESLTIIANSVSDLSALELRAFDPAYSAQVMDDFPGLLATSGVVGEGTCLIYELTDANPRRPVACDAQNFVATLQGPDIFWFNNNTNNFVDIAVYQSDALVQLCPHTNGSGRCDMSQ